VIYEWGREAGGEKRKMKLEKASKASGTAKFIQLAEKIPKGGRNLRKTSPGIRSKGKREKEKGGTLKGS